MPTTESTHTTVAPQREMTPEQITNLWNLLADFQNMPSSGQSLYGNYDPAMASSIQVSLHYYAGRAGCRIPNGRHEVIKRLHIKVIPFKSGEKPLKLTGDGIIPFDGKYSIILNALLGIELNCVGYHESFSVQNVGETDKPKYRVVNHTTGLFFSDEPAALVLRSEMFEIATY